MNYEKFSNILFENKEIDDCVSQKIIEFSNSSNYNPNDNVPKLMRYFGGVFDTYVYQLPLNLLEVGATYFETKTVKVLLLNSNLPKNMMNFTFAHEIYHMLDGAKDRFDRKKSEVVLTDSYYEDPLERKASLFASKLLMPEVEFKKIFRLYREKCENITGVVIELMYYFEVTYTSVLLRIYELGLLDDLKLAEDLLSVSTKDIHCFFEEFCLDKEILEPSKVDESKLVLKKIEEKGAELVAEGFLSKENLNAVIRESQAVIASIVGDVDVK